MKIKGFERTANIAWSPAEDHPIYIAAGTAAQQLDATFSTTAALELYSVNFEEPDFEMKAVGTIASDCRFHKLCWGGYIGEMKDENCGLIVGGADNGSIILWNPHAIISGTDPIIEKLEKHTGAVRALDFNPFQKNLLASGGSESEILIWDLNNTSSTMTPGQKSQPLDDVTCVSWNKQVQHILASTYAGRCVVWDLRKNEPIIKVSDSMSRIKCKLVCWHPEVATQMCMSSEDDHSPVIQLWDLRFATSPLKIFENHTRGILSMAWCPQDPDLLLSCGKDNRILCWNPNSQTQNGEVVYELPTGNEWNFDVKWCPRNPSVISSCSFDGHVSLYSLMGGDMQDDLPNKKITDSFPVDPFDLTASKQPASKDPAIVALTKPPKWIKRPVGACFGFGGKLITFENPKSSSTGQQPHKQQQQVVISQVVTETELVRRSAMLENALNSGQFAEFCTLQVANSKTELEEDIWNFLKIQFEKDPRKKFLDLLGYEQSEISKKIADLTTNEVNEYPILSGGTGELTNKLSQLDTSESGPSDCVNGAESVDFGDMVKLSNLETTSKNETFPFSTEDDCFGLITQALLTANFQAAVEVCLHNDHMAEAIILSIAGGPELLRQTQKHFLEKKCNRKLSTLISSIVTRDYDKVVRNCDLKYWKESLAMLLTYAKGDQFTVLCDVLGSRLEEECDQSVSSNAILCYISSGNIPKLVECVNKMTNNSYYPPNVQNLVEKVMMLQKSIEKQSGVREDVSSHVLADKLSQYSALLASQGSLSTALSYLRASSQPQVQVLRDRICQAIPNYQGGSVAKPFHVINVQPPTPVKNQQFVGQRNQEATQEKYNQHNILSGGQSHNPSSGFYQAHSTGEFKTTPVYSNYQYGGGDNVGKYQHTSTTYNHSSGPALSKGALATKYQPISSQPPSSTNDHFPPSTMYDQAASYGDGYSGRNYSRVSESDPNPVQIYNPSSAVAPGAPHSQSQPIHQPPQTYHDTNAPLSGWNDPPPLKPKKVEPSQINKSVPFPCPITNPIYDVPQQVEQTPPGAPSYMGHMYNQQQYDEQVHQQQQHQQQHSPTVLKQEPPKPVEKGPLPEEHRMLEQIFDRLANQCLTQSNNPHIKRKLDDVLRKLQCLYDKLREERLSQSVTTGLHQIIQAIQSYDYQTALACHAQMVSSGNFSEISSFMPGVKMLLQTAMQMNVYVQ